MMLGNGNLLGFTSNVQLPNVSLLAWYANVNVNLQNKHTICCFRTHIQMMQNKSSLITPGSNVESWEL